MEKFNFDLEKFDFDLEEYYFDIDVYEDTLLQRKEQRKRFAECVKNYNVKNGEKIKIDAKDLDYLMFEKFKIHDKIIKIIALEGDFLKKIDFSEISFDNVLWSANFINSGSYPEFEELVDTKKLYDEGRYEEIDNARQCYDIFLSYFNAQGVTPVHFRYPLDEMPINLSGINANIDFSKGYGYDFIHSYDFSNIKGEFVIPDTAQFYDCNLENINLEGKTIKYATEEDDDDLFDACNYVDLYFSRCNLKNTGATIELFVGTYGDIEKTREQFYKDVESQKFDGCIFEGRIINSQDGHDGIKKH